MESLLFVSWSFDRHPNPVGMDGTVGRVGIVNNDAVFKGTVLLLEIPGSYLGDGEFFPRMLLNRH